jgi:hypothetical protein
LLELIGRAFAALWVAWLAVGLTLAVIFMAIGLLAKE